MHIPGDQGKPNAFVLSKTCALSIYSRVKEKKLKNDVKRLGK